MAFVRLSDIRPLVSKKVGRFYSGTANASDNTTTAMKDDDLGPYPNDFFNRLWFMVTSGTNDGVIRQVDDWVLSTLLVSWTTALPNAAQQSITYEIHQYEPGWVLDAIADAVRNMYPSLARETFVPVGVGGSPLSNPSMEFFASTGVPLEWSTGATAARSPISWRSPSAVALSTTTSTLQYPNSTPIIEEVMRPLIGKSITVYAMSQSGTASQSRLRVTIDGTNTDGSYNTGTGRYEKLSVTVSVSDPSDLPVIHLVYDSNATTAYWDTVWIDGATTDRIYIPRHIFPDGPSHLYAESAQPDDVSGGQLVPLSGWKYGRTELAGVDTSYDYISPGARWAGHVLWARGLSPLSVPTSQTDTTTYVELTADEVRLLVVEAALVLLDRAKGAAPTSAHIALEAKRIDLLREKRALEGGFSSPALSADLPSVWGRR